MSATGMSLRFGVVIADSEHWSDSEKARCEADDPECYDIWVHDQLHELMMLAGQKFIDGHPTLFAVKELV